MPVAKMKGYQREELWVKVNRAIEEAMVSQTQDSTHSDKSAPALSSSIREELLSTKDLEALNKLGEELYKLGKYEEALKWFDEVVGLNPKDPSALNNKGRALYHLGKYEEALKLYDKALELDPKYVTVLNNKGRAFYHLGKYQEALKWCEKALEVDPKYVGALTNRSRILSKLRNK